jgi:uncharacterized tellurite resistance protein B-like protein
LHTQFKMHRKNKDIAGFLILNILAEIDGDFDPKEGKIIVDYIIKNFPVGGNLEEAMEELSTTSQEDYRLLLQKCAEDFYNDSTEKERLELLDFALKLIKADDKINEEEDVMLDRLYQYWDIV